MIGEASVRYLYSEQASRRIHAFNSAARILVLLRGQGRFLPSYHNQLLNNRDESERDFAKLWRSSREGLDRPIPKRCREPSFLDYRAVGDFETQVARYLDVFGPHQVRVAWMEDWSRDPHAFHAWLTDFLEIAPRPRETFPPVNVAHHHRFEFIASFTTNPDPRMLRLAGHVKKALGIERLNIAPRLRRLNRATGYLVKDVPQELRDEIDAYYRESNRRLRARNAELGIEFVPPPADAAGDRERDERRSTNGGG